MKDIIQKISTGKAILFVGAGFSRSGQNIYNNRELPLAKELAKIIGKIGDFDDEGDLKFATDFFLNERCKNNSSLLNTLIQNLKDIFTIKEAKEEHKSIMKAPWKRVYTTNYDDLVELAARSIGKRYETIDIDESSEKYTPNAKICVHLNGTINDLDSTTINSKFKLSSSSYLSPEAFTNSSWHYIFRKDLELSSKIVFIGYSLYDIEIEKILFENPSFRDKVIFIERENKNNSDTTKEDYLFRKYGTLYRIGVSGFASLIEENYDITSSAEEVFYTEAFRKFRDLLHGDETLLLKILYV